MNNLKERRDRYMQDPVPIRLGGLAANLARVSSFANKSGTKEAVDGLLEESQHFIEWTAAETQNETTAELAELQITLAIWRRRWAANCDDQGNRIEISQQAKHFSDLVLMRSGLLDSK